MLLGTLLPWAQVRNADTRERFFFPRSSLASLLLLHLFNDQHNLVLFLALVLPSCVVSVHSLIVLRVTSRYTLFNMSLKRTVEHGGKLAYQLFPWVRPLHPLFREHGLISYVEACMVSSRIRIFLHD